MRKIPDISSPASASTPSSIDDLLLSIKRAIEENERWSSSDSSNNEFTLERLQEINSSNVDLYDDEFDEVYSEIFADLGQGEASEHLPEVAELAGVADNNVGAEALNARAVHMAGGEMDGAYYGDEHALFSSFAKDNVGYSNQFAATNDALGFDSSEDRWQASASSRFHTDSSTQPNMGLEPVTADRYMGEDLVESAVAFSEARADNHAYDDREYYGLHAGGMYNEHKTGLEHSEPKVGAIAANRAGIFDNASNGNNGYAAGGFSMEATRKTHQSLQDVDMVPHASMSFNERNSSSSGAAQSFASAEKSGADKSGGDAEIDLVGSEARGAKVKALESELSPTAGVSLFRKESIGRNGKSADAIINENVAQAVQNSLQVLVNLRKIDDMLTESVLIEQLQPLLKDWLSVNLSSLVEKIVREEMAKLFSNK